MTNTIKIICYLTMTFLIVSCRNNFKACFTVDKSLVNVGDTITFYNCSEYDKGKMDASWTFGDETEAWSEGHESVKHAYSSSGQFEVQLFVGYIESGSKQKMTIVVQ